MVDSMRERYPDSSLGAPSFDPDRSLVYPGIGIEVLDPGFRTSGRLVLRILSLIPSSLRQRVLFGPSEICLTLQKAVQRSLGLGGPALVWIRFKEGPLRDHTFECLTSQRYFLLGPSYEQALQTAFDAVLEKGEVVYDVGAFTGFWSLLFSAMCGPTGHVFAFEPSPINARGLQRHIALNQRHNITVVNLAASDVEATLSLVERGGASRISSTVVTPQERCSQVRTIRLDDFVYRDDHLPPGLVKIDVEGYAGRCLAGMRRILEEVRPAVACEIHDPQEMAEVSQILLESSYEVSRVERFRVPEYHILGNPR